MTERPVQFTAQRRMVLQHPADLRRAKVPESQVRPLPENWRKEPAEYLSVAVVDDLWIERPLDDGWVAAYRLAATPEGAAVIAEMRVFPNEPGRRPGVWSADLLGVRAVVPAGGVTGRVIKDAAPASDLLLGKQAIAAQGIAQTKRTGKLSRVTQALAWFGLTFFWKPPKRVRRSKYSDYELARIAAQCERQQQIGRRDYLVRVGRAEKKPASIIRDILSLARKRGLFTGGGKRGKSGGSGLTELGHQVLSRGESAQEAGR